jgi:transposase
MVERLRVHHDLETLDHLAHQITEVNASLAHLSVCVPWSEDVPFLLQMPGIGLVSAMTILSASGDITHFPTAKQLVGYAGLGAGVRSSGQTTRSGPITKSGRSELRTTLIQFAWAATRYSPYWRDCFSRLAPRKGLQSHHHHRPQNPGRHLACADRSNPRPPRGPGSS